MLIAYFDFSIELTSIESERTGPAAFSSSSSASNAGNTTPLSSKQKRRGISFRGTTPRVLDDTIEVDERSLLAGSSIVEQTAQASN